MVNKGYLRICSWCGTEKYYTNELDPGVKRWFCGIKCQEDYLKQFR